DVRGENGYETLDCASCHLIQKTGNVLPVSYEKNCQSCHKLENEYKAKLKKIPHTTADKVFDEIFNQLSASFFEKKIPTIRKRSKPGKESKNQDRKFEIAKAMILEQARQTEDEVFLKKGCNLCHNLDEKVNFDHN